MRLEIRPVLRKISAGVLDTLFPISCLGCGAPREHLCRTCLDIFPRRLRQRCPTCLHATTPRGESCFACSGKNFLDGLFAASIYRFHLVSASIHTCKYRFIPAFAQPLGVWLGERIAEIGLPLPDLYIPVPLHPRRLRFRGFNQSELLAKTLADTLAPGLGIPVRTDILRRIRYTRPQMKTHTREERLGNLAGAFALVAANAPLIRGKSVWLIDDVATTGTTLEECAKILKRSGAKNVFGIVLAR
ncbi:MAG: ComF family protein [Candidatus Moraniibacteriota bacterium]